MMSVASPVQILSNRNFKPTLSDDHKIGFFSSDRSTQTDTSDIVELKCLSEIIDILTEDAVDMKRDIHFARSVMQADFSTKLKHKSIELYIQVNEKLRAIENQHEERANTVRRAFKQQLADAIAKVHSYYTKNLENKMNQEQLLKNLNRNDVEKRMKDMQATIQRNESVIHLLKMQIQQYQEKEEETVDHIETDDPRIGELIKENNELKNDNTRLENLLEQREQYSSELTSEIDKLQNELEKERIKSEQLKSDQLEKIAKLEKKQTSAIRDMESQKLNQEKMNEEFIKKIKQEALEQAQNATHIIQNEDKEKINKLLQEKRMLEQLIASDKNKAKTEDNHDFELLKRSEFKLQNQVTRLKKEIDRIQKMWEKKFSILQQSLHALKDESFLRQSLQRQATQLHQASITYASEKPVGIMPHTEKLKGLQKKKPPNQSKNPTDFISYTISAPSGRDTTVFSLDEKQIMSDPEQELPPEFVPLPNVLGNSEEFPDEQSVSSSHRSQLKVVMPSL